MALVTGAAGAIGTGICQGLLEAGCLVAATDLPGEPLDTLVETLGADFPGRIVGLPLDVTDPESVAAAFAEVARTWGGVDLVVPNAGVAAVASLTDLGLESYRKLEQVNVEGTLLVLAEAARLLQAAGAPAATSCWSRPRTCSAPGPTSAPTAPPRRRPTNWRASPAWSWPPTTCG